MKTIVMTNMSISELVRSLSVEFAKKMLLIYVQSLFSECTGDSSGWVNSKSEQMRTFNTQGDFGYIKDRRKELKTYCHPKTDESSSLECVDKTRFCRGKNIAIDFNGLDNVPQPMKYRGDVLSDGQVIGYDCDFNKEALLQQGDHKSPLQSWFEEIEHFTITKTKPICDITIDKPTYLMKLDAHVNMYHHFCDFVNLYLTLHFNNSFDLDNNVLIWDTMAYRSNFGVSWKAFTSNPILTLEKFSGKRVCFKNLVFAFLPRMIFGLYYNMPLIPGCHGSGFFQAFNRHILHRLDVKIVEPVDEKQVRITLLSRNTKFRQILNEKELIETLTAKSRKFIVNRVQFTHSTPFLEQVEMMANTDILIGMHGAGLTHALFLPDWAAVFELYNCDDEHCYKDLARLRGVKYLTWQKASKVYAEDDGHHPNLGAHKKFTNYSFDKHEFLRLVMSAVKHVRQKRNRKSSGTNSHDEL